MSTNFRGVPGVYSGPSITPRNIFTGSGDARPRYVSSLLLIDGTNSRDTGNSPTNVLRAGLILGKVTSGGKYRPSILGVTTGAYTSGGTSLSVPAAVATEVARLITNAGGNVSLKVIGPPAAAGTVAVTSCTCSAASGTTLTIADLGVNKADGSIVTPADGSQAPLTVLTSEYGVDVTDSTGTSIDQPLNAFLNGADLIATQVINLVADDFGNSVDTSVQAYLKTQLRANGGLFTFDNDRK